MPAVPRFPCLAAAILAAFASSAAHGQGTLERPLEVRARLTGGAAFTGKVTAWTLDGFSGSFGEHAWVDLVAADLRRTFMQLMDRKDPAQWLRLGELLASVAGGKPLSDDAFAQAKRLGAAPDAIDGARTRGQAALTAREERERMDRERRLQDSTLPKDATAAPWPVLTDAERVQAVERMRQEAVAALEAVGVKGDSVETQSFLLYGDLPRAELQRWGRELDAMYARVADILGVPKGVDLFWGKAVILAFDKQDTFRLAEAAVFNHKAPANLRGVSHMKGPEVFISIYRGNDELDFASTLVHETTHGMVHRFCTPVPLPDWANEGFAEWVARTCVPRGRVDAMRRPQGLAFFRQGGDATRIMAMSGKEGTWPGDNAIGYSVGYLLVDLMIADRPQKFGAWVKAVKGGAAWQKALVDDFGVDPARLAQSASQWYRTNDGTPRGPGK